MSDQVNQLVEAVEDLLDVGTFEGHSKPAFRRVMAALALLKESPSLEAELREAYTIIRVLDMDALDNNQESWPLATQWLERNKQFNTTN